MTEADQGGPFTGWEQFGDGVGRIANAVEHAERAIPNAVLEEWLRLRDRGEVPVLGLEDPDFAERVQSLALFALGMEVAIVVATSAGAKLESEEVDELLRVKGGVPFRDVPLLVRDHLNQRSQSG